MNRKPLFRTLILAAFLAALGMAITNCGSSGTTSALPTISLNCGTGSCL